MVRAFLSIGSNIEPSANVPSALHALAQRVQITSISTIYRTQAEGRSLQPAFYNGVIEFETNIPPLNLKYHALRPIEAALGRIRTQDKYAPRTIDLDLILYGELVLNLNELVLPDPEIMRRSFIAVPLAELQPGLIIPGTVMTASDVAANFRNVSMRPLRAFTASLKNQILSGSFNADCRNS